MRVTRLRVQYFGAIDSADVEFGPGLNVLFGPNDIGKSTLVEALRLALLLQPTQTIYEDWEPWGTTRKPSVELCLQIGEFQYQLRKEFGTTSAASAVLSRSRDRTSWDEIARGRSADGELRKLLRWGVEDPGGRRGPSGMPRSFLATALLSTQAEVGTILATNVSGDLVDSGKMRLAEALAAATQDPLFKKILTGVQERYERAFTPTGEKSTRRDAVLRIASDRVNAARLARDEARALVDSTASVEEELRELEAKLESAQRTVSEEQAKLSALEEVARRAEAHARATELRDAAQEQVAAIDRLVQQETAQCEELAQRQQALRLREDELDAADAAVRRADEEAHLADEAARQATDGATNEQIERQRLQAALNDAERRYESAQRLIDEIGRVRALVDEAERLERALENARREADEAAVSESEAKAADERVKSELARVDKLERGLDRNDIEGKLVQAKNRVERAANLETAVATARDGVRAAEEARAKLEVPGRGTLARVRELEKNLEVARAEMRGGVLVTVEPIEERDVIIVADDGPREGMRIARSIAVEARGSVEVLLPGIATVRSEAGNAVQRERLLALDAQWAAEARPILEAANVGTADELQEQIGAAELLDREAAEGQQEVERLASELATLASARSELEAARTALAAAPSAGATNDDIAALGPEPRQTLRSRRESLRKELETVASATRATEAALRRQQVETAERDYGKASTERDQALAAFLGKDVEGAAAGAEGALKDADRDRGAASEELGSIETSAALKKEALAKAIGDANSKATQAHTDLDRARSNHAEAMKLEASAAGRLEQVRVQLGQCDAPAAQAALADAQDALAGTPAPEQQVTTGDVDRQRTVVSSATEKLATVERELNRAQGKLEQVGGAVAREGLRDAEEAFRLAEADERAKDDEYAGWRMLREQLLEAEKAQASHLGQKLAPAINERFATLTGSRYGGITMDAQLSTQGIVAGGALQSVKRLSVGTRDQLSTLYRLAIAEYLQSAVVLDDQLVQSDHVRLDWFRQLLREKAQIFQIIVFTCRPGDYLGENLVQGTRTESAGADDGLMRAVDLGQLVRGAGSTAPPV